MGKGVECVSLRALPLNGKYTLTGLGETSAVRQENVVRQLPHRDRSLITLDV